MKNLSSVALVRTARFSYKSTRQRKANAPLKYLNLSFASLTKKSKRKHENSKSAFKFTIKWNPELPHFIGDCWKISWNNSIWNKNKHWNRHYEVNFPFSNYLRNEILYKVVVAFQGKSVSSIAFSLWLSRKKPSQEHLAKQSDCFPAEITHANGVVLSVKCWEQVVSPAFMKDTFQPHSLLSCCFGHGSQLKIMPNGLEE